MDDPRYEAGMKVRREVLGDEHVDRATAAATDFSRPFQEYITRSAWGEAWTLGFVCTARLRGRGVAATHSQSPSSHLKPET